MTMGREQSYDPHRLIEDVAELLEARGLIPVRTEIETPGARLLGAGLLLRGLGVQPRLSSERAFDPFSSRNYDSRMHED
jgi:hypothetical protein